MTTPVLEVAVLVPGGVSTTLDTLVVAVVAATLSLAVGFAWGFMIGHHAATRRAIDTGVAERVREARGRAR
jgi:hypothetical protein